MRAVASFALSVASCGGVVQPEASPPALVGQGAPSAVPVARIAPVVPAPVTSWTVELATVADALRNVDGRVFYATAAR